MSKHLAAVSLSILLIGAAVLHGHEGFGPVVVNQVLKSLQQSQATIKGNAPPFQKEEAVFNTGVDGYALMKMINSEIQEHGGEADRGLIALAINRAKAAGVNVQQVAGEDYFMYDFAAFASYLKMAPRGAYAAEARFALIEKSFYDHRRSERTPDVVLKHIQEKKQLLQDYPKLGRRADLEMFLVLDYFEMYRNYEEKNDRVKGAQYRDLAMNLCQQVIKNYPDTGASNFARDLLLKFGL